MKESIEKIALSNALLVSMNKSYQEELSSLHRVCLEIYEGLSEKKELTLHEECWEQGLYKLLFKKEEV